jgi:drug/metabolite transporter (DMT)-like permease
VTNKYAKGFNGITVFVLLTAASLWIYYFMTPQPEMIFSTSVTIKMFSAALTLGFAYAAWNIGILHGNVTIMAVGSILPLCSLLHWLLCYSVHRFRYLSGRAH